MAIFTGINLSGSSNEEIVDAITALNRSLEFQMNNLDDDNIRELDYSKMIGGPPVNADNTRNILTVGGTNFTVTNGAYVYSGPVQYTNVSGGPPANADNTGLNLPASLGINFTVIGQSYIYTGTLSANQINAGTLNANFINGGTLNGVVFRATQPAGGGYLEISPSSVDGSPGIAIHTSDGVARGGVYLTGLIGGKYYMTLYGGPDGVQITASDIWMNGNVRFNSGATVTGLNVTAKFG